MRIYHSYIAVRLRSSGKFRVLAENWGMASGDSGDISAKADELFDSPKSGKDFSHVLFVRDNEVVRSLELPDPSELEKAAKQAELAAARARLESSKASEASAGAASDASQAALEARQRDEAAVAALEAALGIAPAPEPELLPAPDPDATPPVLS
jgi:hypothetical protein